MATDDELDRPPFFRSWRGVYALVLGSLAVSVVILSLLSWIYR